jgi:hypothetical protein
VLVVVPPAHRPIMAAHVHRKNTFLLCPHPWIIDDIYFHNMLLALITVPFSY